jgi:hypothetical protein
LFWFELIVAGEELVARMESIVSEEGCKAGGAGNFVVVAEFGKGQEVSPVILLIVTISSEVLFKNGINPFGLAISLGVEGSGKELLDLEDFAEFSGEARGKNGATIGNNS